MFVIIIHTDNSVEKQKERLNSKNRGTKLIGVRDIMNI